MLTFISVLCMILVLLAACFPSPGPTRSSNSQSFTSAQQPTATFPPTQPHIKVPSISSSNSEPATPVSSESAILATIATNSAPQPMREMLVSRVFPNLDFMELTNLVQPDDGFGRIYVTEQTGRILVFPDDQLVTEASVFLDIRDRVNDTNDEEGLLGLAFDSNFRHNGFLYIYYSATHPRRSVLSRFSITQDGLNAADPDSELIIMEIPQLAGNHNGGQIAIWLDGYLYVGVGDGGRAGDPFGNGQNIGTLLGSILRIDVNGPSDGRNYRIPPDNPFVGITGARKEIWAYGFRNPWRFSFDNQTELLWVADVGQNEWEEINLVQKGLNYGWNIMEGRHCFPPSRDCNSASLQLPIFEYDHSAGCSITGGGVYNGNQIPSLLGAYVYGDFCSGDIWGLRYNGESVTEHRLLADSALSITSFGQDVAGNLYVLSRSEGIYALLPSE